MPRLHMDHETVYYANGKPYLTLKSQDKPPEVIEYRGGRYMLERLYQSRLVTLDKKLQSARSAAHGAVVIALVSLLLSGTALILTAL